MKSVGVLPIVLCFLTTQASGTGGSPIGGAADGERGREAAISVPSEHNPPADETLASTRATFLVRPDGSGDFPTIQDAIAFASDGDAIELSDGAFKGPGNRDIDFLGKRLVLRSQSGDPNRCAIDCEGTAEDPHAAFRFMSGEPFGTSVERLTVTNGREGTISCGAASSVSMTGCVITRNRGESAITIEGASMHLTDCLISDNRQIYTGAGGGILCTSGGSLSATRCTFSGNNAVDGCGGAVCMGSSSATFVDCLFINNNGSPTGGIWSSACPIIIVGCSFVGNTTDSEAGALSIGGPSVALVSECSFLSNHHTQGSGGGSGAMQFSGGSPVIEKCTIRGNSGSTGPGGINISDAVAARVRECVIVGNNGMGGGIGCWGSNWELQNTTVSGNSGGGIMLFQGSTLLADRSIIFGNCDSDVQFELEPSAVSLNCCAIDPAGIHGDGTINYLENNIFTDPLFCDPEPCANAPTVQGDCSLTGNSPCLPQFSPCGDLIGALGAGCATSSVPEALGTRAGARVWPNPSSRGFDVSCIVREEGEVIARVVDVRGRVVRHLFRGRRGVGPSTLHWDGSDDRGRALPTGIYMIRIEVPGGVERGTAIIQR